MSTNRGFDKFGDLKATDHVPDNYPPTGDTTSEGGFGYGQSFVPESQRGLIEQSTEGLPLGSELQDAYQGSDDASKEQFEREQSRHGQGLNPYGKGTLENRKDGEDKLISAFRDARSRQYESGPAASNDMDAGA